MQDSIFELQTQLETSLSFEQFYTQEAEEWSYDWKISKFDHSNQQKCM